MVPPVRKVVQVQTSADVACKQVRSRHQSPLPAACPSSSRACTLQKLVTRVKLGQEITRFFDKHKAQQVCSQLICWPEHVLNAQDPNITRLSALAGH